MIKLILHAIFIGLGIVVLLVGFMIWDTCRGRSRPTDHFSIESGRTTTAHLNCPAQNYQWSSHFSFPNLPKKLIDEPSEVVIRLKNEGKEAIQLAGGPGSYNAEFAPGETKEIFRGSLKDLSSGGRSLSFFTPSHGSEVPIELQIDATFASDRYLNLDLSWNYIDYFL